VTVDGRYEGAMAQLVAHPTPDRKVRSSILFGLTLFTIQHSHTVSLHLVFCFNNYKLN
jgi:hypothetical protein